MHILLLSCVDKRINKIVVHYFLKTDFEVNRFKSIFPFGRRRLCQLKWLPVIINSNKRCQKKNTIHSNTKEHYSDRKVMPHRLAPTNTQLHRKLKFFRKVPYILNIRNVVVVATSNPKYCIIIEFRKTNDVRFDDVSERNKNIPGKV